MLLCLSKHSPDAVVAHFCAPARICLSPCVVLSFFLHVTRTDDPHRCKRSIKSQNQITAHFCPSMPVASLNKSLTYHCLRNVRGFCVATGPYFSFCGCTRDLLLGSSDHMEDDEQNREGEETGQDVQTLEREEEINGDNERSDT